MLSLENVCEMIMDKLYTSLRPILKHPEVPDIYPEKGNDCKKLTGNKDTVELCLC